jgi:DNA-binding response OmpR family regulator
MRKKTMQSGDSRRVLIIEDNLLVAEHMATIIGEAGFTALGPVATNDEARTMLDNPANAFDAVLLDLQLDRSSLMIADQLRGAGIPFVFATGNRSNIPPEYSEHPVCEKPFSPRRLVEALYLAFGTEDQISRDA